MPKTKPKSKNHRPNSPHHSHRPDPREKQSLPTIANALAVLAGRVELAISRGDFADAFRLIDITRPLASMDPLPPDMTRAPLPLARFAGPRTVALFAAHHVEHVADLLTTREPPLETAIGRTEVRELWVQLAAWVATVQREREEARMERLAGEQRALRAAKT